MHKEANQASDISGAGSGNQASDMHLPEYMNHSGERSSAELSQAISPELHLQLPTASTELPFATAIPFLLSHIRVLDLAEQGRLEYILNLKNAMADGTYNVGTAEVARKLIDYMAGVH